MGAKPGRNTADEASTLAWKSLESIPGEVCRTAASSTRICSSPGQGSSLRWNESHELEESPHSDGILFPLYTSNRCLFLFMLQFTKLLVISLQLLEQPGGGGWEGWRLLSRNTWPSLPAQRSVTSPICSYMLGCTAQFTSLRTEYTPSNNPGRNCTGPLTCGLHCSPCTCVSLNMFFSLPYFIVRIQCMIHMTNKICVN